MSGNDTRQSLASALVAGAVVLVVGWGSGLGTLISGAVAAPARVDVPAAPTVPGAASTDSAGTLAGAAVAGVASGYLPVATGSGSSQGAGSSPSPSPTHHGGSSTTTPATPPTSSTAPASGAPAPASGGTSDGSCTSLVDAIAQPFIAHLEAGHLEESPAQQVADILNISQYVKTHTTLIEAMLQPLYAVLPAVARSIDAFVQHVYHGHLEESPAQQVADILNVSQYLKTHTVLVESMVTPIEQTGSGC